MILSKLPKVKTFRKGKRVGRGFGSGKGGHTTGRGAKGQKARSSVKVGFEGGQVPLYKRLPQLGGFINHASKDIIAVPLAKFNIFEDGKTVTARTLLEAKIIDRLPKHGVKILSNGSLGKKLELKGFKATKVAIEKIEKSGSKLS